MRVSIGSAGVAMAFGVVLGLAAAGRAWAAPPALPTPGEAGARGDPHADEGVGVRTWLSPLLRFRPVDVSQGGADPAALKARYATLGYDLDVLIATLPDPIDSGMGLEFDRGVDAIGAALSAMHYVRDGFWLPWERDRGAGRDDATQAPGSAENGAQPDRRLRERLPGAILFRGPPAAGLAGGPPGREQLLLLLLVGETPTAGVHKRAFAEALSFAALCGDAKPVRVLGPSFSGTRRSLRIAIEGWFDALPSSPGAPADVNIEIISGSATNPQNRHELEETRCRGERHCVRYRATVLPDDLIIATAYQFLQPRRHRGGELCRGADCYLADVALLYEASTAYGSRFADEEQSGAELHELRPGLLLPFPLHVARIRGERWKDRDKAAAATPGPADPLSLPAASSPPRDALPLAFEPSARRDAPPHFSPETVSSDELLLDGSLSLLAAAKVRYVGIVASDLNDRIFLAAEVRKYVPNVLVFLIASDVILGHPDLAQSLEGAVLFGSYPVFPGNQLQTAPYPQRIERLVPLPTDRAYGVFNATVALVQPAEFAAGHQHALEYAAPLAPLSAPRRPPVWIAAVGQGGLAPLGFRDAIEDPSGSLYLPASAEVDPRRGPPRAVIHTARTWSVLLWLMFSFVVVNCAGYLTVRLRAERQSCLPPGFRWAELFEAPRAAAVEPNRFSLATQHRLLRTACFLALLLPCVVLGPFVAAPQAERWLRLPVEVVWHADHFSLGLSRLLGGLWILAAAGAALAAADALCAKLGEGRGFFARRGPRIVVTFLLATGLLGGGAAASVAAVRWASVEMHFATGGAASDLRWFVLFYQRATDLANGVSPVWPFLCVCAVFYSFAVCHLRRVAQIEHSGLPNPLSESRGSDSAGIAELEERVRATLYSPYRRRRSIAPFGVALVVLLVVVFAPRFLTLEGAPGDVLFAGALLIAAALIVQSAIQLGATWFDFSRLLRRLSGHPIVYAFAPERDEQPHGDPSGFSPLSLLWPATDDVPSYAQLATTIRKWHLVAHQFEEDPEVREHPLIVASRERIRTAMQKCTQAEAEFTAEYAKVSAGLVSLRPIHSKAQRALAEVCRQLAPLLGQVWMVRELQPGSARASLDSPESDRKVDAWLGAVERLVASQAAIFSQHVVAQLRNLLTFVTVGALLFLLAVTSYPFQPRHLLMVACWALVLGAAGAGLALIVRLERDEVLSRIAGTAPGRITWDWQFVAKLFTYGAVPLLSLLAAQVPHIGGLLFSWVDPILRALR